ncbi:uroporphyrinogen-III synthase [Aquibacillus sp. 3ASR75-11]|uniref:Uroporphyrinogen-III synthase n=1 Tax=Terrihalobacillus insolitus TaxID=2950438 RepID=A0A9X3WTE3_9BACI|nr:uroporphyrinogen-III synthase [Terrihalobacillus insolitus]MDC3412487.1 uroporphyrinogen-III synthase [Terrihalobacillus insolitus]MDC3423906.1 uroporphyrinogen-III synthase [Terrihalobacillus insolitus]
MHPLEGKKVLVTRSKEQAKDFVTQLERVGAIPIVTPLLTFQLQLSEANQDILHRLQNFTWILFTSSNGVQFFFESLKHYDLLDQIPNAIQFGVVGHKTKQVLHSHGFKADFVPHTFNGETFIHAFLESYGKNERVLVVRGNQSLHTIPSMLQKFHVSFESIEVYQTIPNIEYKEDIVDYIKSGDIDAYSFTSPSTVETFDMLTNHIPNIVSLIKADKLCVCIGTTTADKAMEKGFKNICTPKHRFTMEGMVDALVQYYKEERKW